MKVAGIFGDNMVLQQGVRVPVWGTAEPGTKVTVEFGRQRKSAVADRAGRWLVRLAPLRTSAKPRVLTISGAAGGRRIELGNVLVGEVWIGSGQSNMQWSVRDSTDSEREIREAAYPKIRLFTVPNVALAKPAPDIRGQWTPCGPDTVAGFSAAAYFFGRELHRRLRVPIGLINCSWGGTRIETWISRKGLMTDKKCRREILGYEAALKNPDDLQSDYRRRLQEYQEWEKNNLPRDAGNSGYGQGWADPGLNDADWRGMTIPRYWQSAGQAISGVFWFRREIDLPAEYAGKDLALSLGPLDKSDITYFNNEEVGRVARETANCWAQPRVYTVPGRLVKPGRNLIATRILSDCFAGGFGGNPPDLHLSLPGAETRIARLDGVWKYKIEQDFGQIAVPNPPPPPFGDGNANTPYILFDNMIRPLLPFGIRGAIWYQGESNAQTPGPYRKLMPLLIRDWRAAWRQDSFPFLFVQLPNYMGRGAQPGESAWAELREAQFMALSVPKTGMAVAIDIGEAADVHPKNKQDIGLRLALATLGGVYGKKKVVPSGPLFKAYTIRGNAVHVRFSHVGGGLVTRGAKLTGFAMAGRDRRFVWAEAVIEAPARRGQPAATVVVSSPQVPKPVAVRYAWADNPECNLYNQVGLPASPFRTDRWGR
jgi:sialate O-acetylesterase